MFLPTNPEFRLQWREPWLFKLRTMAASGWLLRFFLLAAVYLVCGGMLYNGRPEAEQQLTIQERLIPLLPAGVLVLLLELPTLQRVVSIHEYEITWVGAFVPPGINLLTLLVWMGRWNRREIKRVVLQRAGDAENRFGFGVLTIEPKHAAAHKIAIPNSVTLDDVAEQLHAIGIDVELSNWQPALATTSS